MKVIRTTGIQLLLPVSQNDQLKETALTDKINGTTTNGTAEDISRLDQNCLW